MAPAEEQPPPGTRLVLLVEDEASLVASVSYFLRKDGFRVVAASDGLAGLQAARSERPDVIVLDLMLPAMDGLEVCRRVRAESSVPILMLTARTEETDRVVGLELGADDYMTKPFSMRELAARLRALIRRAGRREPQDGGTSVAAGALVIDPRGRTVFRGGVELPMKPKEFDLLHFLMTNPGQVFTRDQLIEHVWGYNFFGETRTVDVHIRWLREKIELDPGRPQHLLTLRGVGYKFVR